MFDAGLLINPTNKYIVCCDAEQIIKEEFSEESSTKEEHDLSVGRAIINIQERSIMINYELPMNTRFVDQLSRTALYRVYVVDKTLQDKMTIFGKSQPDVSIYKIGGGYIRGNTIVGAALSFRNTVSIMAGDNSWNY